MNMEESKAWIVFPYVFSEWFACDYHMTKVFAIPCRVSACIKDLDWLNVAYSISLVSSGLGNLYKLQKVKE